MQAVKRTFATLLGVLLLWGMWSPLAWGADVYVVYAGKDKSNKTQLVKALPSDLSVKAYNVDLLAVSDYSGKQKVLAKFSGARLVVILLDASMLILEGSTVNTGLMIVKSVKQTVRSDEWTVYVVTKGTDLTNLGRTVKILTATRPGDLTDAREIRASNVIVVDEARLGFFKAVSLIAVRVLGS